MIFDKSISCYNPGSLFGGLTIDQLRLDNYSAHTRNKLIAEAFYLTGDIEKYGTGFLRIRSEIKNYPTMKFLFSEADDGFRCGFEYENQRITENVTENVTENRSGLILIELKKNRTMTVDQLAAMLNANRRTIIRDIEKLKENGKIKRIGSAKGGYWQVEDF